MTRKISCIILNGNVFLSRCYLEFLRAVFHLGWLGVKITRKFFLPSSRFCWRFRRTFAQDELSPFPVGSSFCFCLRGWWKGGEGELHITHRPCRGGTAADSNYVYDWTYSFEPLNCERTVWSINHLCHWTYSFELLWMNNVIRHVVSGQCYQSCVSLNVLIWAVKLWANSVIS